jgi:elongation factor 1-beta
MHKVFVNRPDHFFFYSVKMTADYCNFPMETVFVDKEMEESKEFKAKKSFRKFPMMETPQGVLISESTAIAAYIARVSNRQDFLGNSAFEEGQVESAVCFASSSIVPNMYKVALHCFGWKDDKNAHDAGLKAIKEAVKVLNSTLEGSAWLVGDRLTLADIVTFNALLVPFTLSLDGGFRKAMPNVAAWFLKMSKLPVVTRTAGYVKWLGAGQDQAAPAGGAAKGKAAKAKGGKAAAAPKKEAPKPAAAAEDDDFDPFAEDPEADAAAAAALKKKGEEAKAGKKKAAPIAKSLLIWEVKPWGEETDLQILADKILAIQMDGLSWKTEWKKEPVAYGIFKIQIGATIEDDKCSTDAVQEAIEAFEDEVQSVDIVAFNKL